LKLPNYRPNLARSHVKVRAKLQGFYSSRGNATPRLLRKNMVIGKLAWSIKNQALTFARLKKKI
jgi:hypothetical protein